jgi:enamine deaminase RidA (YjgF/YER057c/UK114 family)
MLSHSRYNVILLKPNPGPAILCPAVLCPAGDETIPGVQPQRISGSSPYEAIFGFSRAVVVGQRILVAGTTPIPPAGGPPPAGAYDQARLCLDLIGEALARAGAGLEHVVRTRMYLTGAEHWPEVARAHGEAFAGIRPASTAVIVAGLLEPAWLVEIEAEALLPEP